MLKSLALILGTAVLVLMPQTAEATRPVPGFVYTDQCRNIAGVQPSYQMVGTGPYRFVGDPANKWCRRR